MWNKKKKNLPEPVISYWKGYLKTEEIIEFLDNNCLEGSLLHTEFNHSEFKCYGHPIRGRQDWVEVKIEGHILQVQCLIFCHIPQKLDKTIKTMLYNVDGPGTYAIVHFLEYNIFGKYDRRWKLYGHQQRNFYQDEDCFLIRGWSKHTDKIKDHILEGEVPSPTIAMIPVECIMSPLIAIEDTGSGYPHSWLLMKSRETWAGAFVATMMKERACRAVLNK